MLISKNLLVKEVSGVMVVNFIDKKISNEQDIYHIGQQLLSLVDFSNKIIIDFVDVEYISCALLGKLIALHKRIEDSNGTLIIYNLNLQISEVFLTTKLNKFFNITNDKQEALHYFTTVPAETRSSQALS